jgi:hypothetical protein
MKLNHVFKVFQEVTEANPADAKVLPPLPESVEAKISFFPGGSFPKVQVTTPARPAFQIVSFREFVLCSQVYTMESKHLPFRHRFCTPLYPVTNGSQN